MVWRWIVGFLKRLVRIWDEREASYYTYTGLDPDLPAFQRWELQLKSSDVPAETPAEELLPRKSHSLVLHDKYGQTLDEVIYFTSDLGRVELLEKKLAEELQSRNAGWFWYDQIHNRNLDFIHNIRLGEEIAEGTAGEDELEATRRDFFRG